MHVSFLYLPMYISKCHPYLRSPCAFFHAIFGASFGAFVSSLVDQEHYNKTTPSVRILTPTVLDIPLLGRYSAHSPHHGAFNLGFPRH